MRKARNGMILVVGPLPPPTHGAAKNTEIFAKDLESSGAQIIRLGTNVKDGTAHQRGARHHIRRVVLLFKNVSLILGYRGRIGAMYLVADGGFGLIYNLVYVLLSRALGLKNIWIHHRNMHSIISGGLLLRTLAWAAGGAAHNIFLDEGMQDLFRRRIRFQDSGIVISNAATCDIDQDEVARIRSTRLSSDCLKVGYLSNLNDGKGFDVVEKVIYKVAERNIPVEFHIAGAATDVVSKRRLDRILSHHAHIVTYLGPVHGNRKRDFYTSLDVFLFPTKYKFEAQPNVIFEALAAGLSVISTEHACIPSMLKGNCHRLIAIDDADSMADRCAFQIAKLATASNLKRLRDRASKDIQSRFSIARREAKASYVEFLDRLAADKSN